MELKHYLAIVRRWGWIMLLCTVLASVTSYWFSVRLPRVYESQARYLVGPALDNPNVTSNDLRASSQVGQTYAELATSRPIVQSVIDKLNLNARAEVVARNVTATWIDAPQILNIRVRASDPETPANIANAIGEELIARSPAGPSSLQAERRQAAILRIAQLQGTIRDTEAEIDQLTNQVQQTTDQVTQRALIVRLDQRRAQLAAAQRALSDQYTILQSSTTNQIAVLEPAVRNDNPIAPDIRQNVLAALIAGLVLGLAAMLIFEYFTDVTYTPEELRKATGLPYLGGIARHKKLRGTDTAQLVTLARPETLAAESYRILRANLHIAGAALHQPSLLITSPSRGDGKSEIAANLAIAFAQTDMRVILIDANLRRPRLASLFGLPDDVGLSSLLDNPAQELEPLPVASVPGLSVLPAGPPTPNSSEIFASSRMYRLLQELKGRADVVILDSSPLLYADALVLAPQVDSVLLVASSGATGRENTINAVESLRLVGARLAGSVLNRVKPGPAYFYYPSHARKRPAIIYAPPALESPAGTGEVQEHVAQLMPPLEADGARNGWPVAQPPADTAQIEDELARPAIVEPTDQTPAKVTEVVNEPAATTQVLAELAEPDPAQLEAEPVASSTEEAVEALDTEMSIEVGGSRASYEDGQAAIEPEIETIAAGAAAPVRPTNGRDSSPHDGTVHRRKSRRQGRG